MISNVSRSMILTLLLCVTALPVAYGVAPEDGIVDQVYYFYTPGCSLCEEVAPLLQEMESKGLISVLAYNLHEVSSLVVMQELLLARGLPSELAGTSPSVFSDSGELIGSFSKQDIIDLIEMNDISRIGLFRRSGIILAGLADGVNPCTLNVLLVLLSICAFAGREKVWKVGLTFVLGVIFIYMIVGVGLGASITRISILATIVPVIYLAVGIVMLVTALWPNTKKTSQIKKAIGKQIGRLRNSGMTAATVFTMGMLSSAFEFVCTGQIYIPFLIYLSTQRVGTLVASVALYNVAFSMPMSTMIAAMYFGMGSVTVQRVLKRPVVAKLSNASTALLGLYLIVQGYFGLGK